MSFEEVLERDGSIVYYSVGDSMEPLIRSGRDLLVIEKPRGRLKKYDIPLYRRASGQYILHRIIQVKEDGYVACGDNRFTTEYPVRDSQIIGVLTALTREGRIIPLKGFRYRLYVFFWCDLFLIRSWILKCIYIFDRFKKGNLLRRKRK
ncbi:MAG: S24/S26 family peptidase [Blautia sp.]|nr:S24/S26 family peptidase [Blautia sp.]